jgi:hypothetical protein
MRMSHCALGIPASTITAGVHKLSQKSGGHHQHKPVPMCKTLLCKRKDKAIYSHSSGIRGRRLEGAMAALE